MENFDEFTFAECTKTSVKEKTVVQEKTVVRKNKVPKGRMDRFDKSEKKPVKPFNNKLRIAVIISIVLFIAVVSVVIIISSDNGRKIFPHYDDMDKLVVITEEDLNITFSGYDGAGIGLSVDCGGNSEAVTLGRICRALCQRQQRCVFDVWDREKIRTCGCK